MPLIRGHQSFDDHFTQIPNSWLRDSRISLAAKGLIAQLMSHKPGWKISIYTLAHQNGIGKDGMRTILNELLNAGYLARSAERERTSQGFLGSYTYTTQDPLFLGNADEPTLDEPTLVNPPHKNTNIKEKQFKEYNPQNEFEDFWNLYPRKVGKQDAFKAFKKAIATTPFIAIYVGVQKLATDPNLPEKQFIPHPATWLNEGRWSDEPYPERLKTQDELDAIRREKYQKDRDAQLRATAEVMAQSEKAKAQASKFVPKCEHGNTIARCIRCLNKKS